MNTQHALKDHKKEEIKSSMDKAAQKVESVVKNGASKIDEKMDGKMSDALESPVETIRSFASDFTEKAKDTVGSAIDTLRDGEWMKDVSARAQDVDASVRGFIRKRPGTSLAIAAGLGFLVAKLVTSQTSSDPQNRKSV